MLSLTGKNVVVTGGSRGIGRAIAHHFVKAGANVLTCGRRDRPTDLEDDIEWLKADVSDLSDVEALANFARSTLGTVNVLVNNAGILIEKTVLDTTNDDWEKLIGVNARGVFYCCREFIPLMIEGGGGSVINIGSISGKVADPGTALYNASKAFVHGLTRSIAVDHGKDGIHCNAICPGWIMTDMSDGAFDIARDPEAARQHAIERHAVRRLGEPSDIAKAAAWLASDDSEFATGQMFVIDGGLTAASPLNLSLF